MKNLPESLVCAALLLASLLTTSGTAAGATPYIIANDDASFPFTGVTFFAVGANGGLTSRKLVATVGIGIGGGFFGANRIRVLNNANQSCVFASEAGSGDIVGIDVNTFAVGGSASGTATDDGSGNGIGLALNDQYLYASFAESNTIGTFHVLSGCGLTFINDTSVGGLQGGFINGMAVHGNILVTTFTDGTIESFDISGGTPLSNGDKQLSSATIRSRGATFPNSIDITSDGHFAIFGDTSTSLIVEVSDISSGKLGKTKAYTSTASISSSNILLSPDETLLYVVNTQGDSVSALFFDKSTGKLTPGCTSDPIQGQTSDWSYLAGAALASNTGNGDGVYVTEFPAGIAHIKIRVKGKTCSLRKAVQSPITDKDAVGLLSIGAYPPRSF